MFSDMVDSNDVVEARPKLVQRENEPVVTFIARVSEVISEMAHYIYTQGAMSEEDQREAFDIDRQVACSVGLQAEIKQIIGRERPKDFKGRVKLAKVAKRG